MSSDRLVTVEDEHEPVYSDHANDTVRDPPTAIGSEAPNSAELAENQAEVPDHLVTAREDARRLQATLAMLNDELTEDGAEAPLANPPAEGAPGVIQVNFNGSECLTLG